MLDDGRLVGATLIGDIAEAGRIHDLIRSGRDVDDDLIADRAPVASAADELVCTCETVSRSTMRAVRAAAR